MLIKFMLLQKSSSVPTIAGSETQGALRPNQLIPTHILFNFRLPLPQTTPSYLVLSNGAKL